jgi:sodium-dependent dicarboxylate transporter 2/3/5
MKKSATNADFRWGFWVGFVCFILILLIPTSQDFTLPIKNMMAVAVLMAIWWMAETLPLGVTALIPLVAYPVLGIMSTGEVSGNYTHHLVFLFLGGFVIASGLQEWQLHKRFALFTIAILGTQPRKVILAFMLSSALLSMWISNTATTIMMLPIALAVIGEVGQRNHATRGDKFTIVLLLGVAYGASIGGISTLIGTPPNIIFSGIFNKYFPQLDEISFLQWMVYILPLSSVMFVVIWGYLAFLVYNGKKDKSEKSGGDFKKGYRELGKMSMPQRKVLLIFSLTAFLWIFRTDINLGFLSIPGWPRIFGLQNMIQDSTIAVGMAILLFIVPAQKKSQKSGLLQLRNLLNIPWDILLLFGGGFALADGIQKSGMATFLGNQLVFFGNFPVWLMLFTLALSVTIFTEITSNTAVATTILPITAALAVKLAMNPLLIMLPVTVASSCAFMLPVATPPNAIVFGSRFIPIKSMVKVGIGLNLIAAFIISIYFYIFFNH